MSKPTTLVAETSCHSESESDYNCCIENELREREIYFNMLLDLGLKLRDAESDD